jgi:hypothetical protein
MIGTHPPTRLSTHHPADAVAIAPEVLFIDDLVKILLTSRSTIERRRRAGTFPIPELPAIDERPRWSRRAVERYLASTNGGLRPRRGRPRSTRRA